MPTTQSTKRYLAGMLTVLMMVSIVNVADKELLAPVAHAVKHDLNMHDTHLGLVRSSVFMAALMGQFLWGPLSDRWVRKYVITIGTIVWSAITWLTAFVTSFPQLLLARAGMSFAEGCFNPSAWALITDTFPKQRHGLVLGLMSLTYPVGTAAALVLASIVGTEQWREPFKMYGIVGILLGFLVLVLVREPKRGATEDKVVEAQGVYTGLFSWAELKKIFSIPSLLWLFALDTCQASVNWTIAFWAPTYLIRYQIAPNDEMAAIALLPAIVGFVLGALLGGWLIDRLRGRSQLVPAWVALAAMAGGLGMALVVFNAFQLVPLMVAAFFLGLITYMVMPAVSIMMFAVVPPELKASTISISNIILNLVIAVISVGIGALSDAYELRWSFGGAVLLMFGLGVIVCLNLLRTLRRDMERQRAEVEARIMPGESSILASNV